MKLRLGWEYFVDLSYRSHFNHTLELNGVAVADVPTELLKLSADRLANQLRNDLPSAPDFNPLLLTRLLAGVVQRMRRQGSISHPYVESAVVKSKGPNGPHWFAASHQMGLRPNSTLPVPNSRRGLSPIPVTLHNATVGFERITRSSWYRDWLFRTLGQANLLYGSDPDSIYPLLLQRLEADDIVRRVDSEEGQPSAKILILSLSISICGPAERGRKQEAARRRQPPSCRASAWMVEGVHDAAVPRRARLRPICSIRRKTSWSSSAVLPEVGSDFRCASAQSRAGFPVTSIKVPSYCFREFFAKPPGYRASHASPNG